MLNSKLSIDITWRISAPRFTVIKFVSQTRGALKVEAHFNFSLVHDQNVLFQQSICLRMWVERKPFKGVLRVFGKRLWWARRKDDKKSFDPPY